MDFLWPLDVVSISQKFGVKSSAYPLGYHMGIDLRCKRGTPVKAAQTGKVIVSKSSPPFDGYGAHVVLDHGNGFFSIYGHLDVVSVKVGDKIEMGATVGLSGGNPRDYGAKGGAKTVNGKLTKAGNSTGPHLHYEIDKGGVGVKLSIDPAKITFYPEKFMALKIPEWAKGAADKAKKKNLITDWSNPLEKVGEEKLEWIFEKLGLLDPKKHEGNITLSRLACVLDKLGLLEK